MDTETVGRFRGGVLRVTRKRRKGKKKTLTDMRNEWRKRLPLVAGKKKKKNVGVTFGSTVVN